MYSYPDIVVTCEKMEFHDELQGMVVNPTATFEVLSPSTEQFDRGEKSHRLQRWQPTLTDYALVPQGAPNVEHFLRQPDSNRPYVWYDRLDQKCPIEAIREQLSLADVYDRMTFPAPPS
jgi:hypothetical protein